MTKVLITGGTGLLGKAMVKGFLEKKCQVHFTSTSLKNSNKLLRGLTAKEKKNCFPIIQTFKDINDIKYFIQNYNKIGFNILINNARDLLNVNFKQDSFEQIKNFEIEMFMAIYLPFFLSIKLNKNKLQSIINISSMYGIVAPNKKIYKDGYKSSPAFYGISKAAQIHLTKELAVRMAKDRIRVNCVSFGGVEGRVNNSFKKKYANLCPMGRMLKSSEIFEPIWFLANENLSSGSTGHNLIIDGGWTIW